MGLPSEGQTLDWENLASPNKHDGWRKARYKWTTGWPGKIIFSPLDIKLGLTKEFVKALNKEGNCFQYICLAFPDLGYEKVKSKLHYVLWQLWKTFWEMTRLKIAKMWLKQCFKVIIILGQMLAKFNQLKRNKRFNFILLVWVQGSLFHIAAGSHPVQKAWVTR